MRSILRFGLLAGAVVIAAVTLRPTPAQAWWVRPWGWRPAVVVVPAPVVVAPPVYVVPRRVHWVHGHYDWRGYWIPAHWV